MSAAKGQIRSVLVTGASTGIGAACALALDQRGFQVFAGVRSEPAAELLQSKASPRLKPLMIDVTDAAAIHAAAAQIKEETGQRGLAGLVNNAGIVVSGPLEILPIDQLRRQIEVNVIGQVAVTQAMLPFLRIAKGRIVNISSINGAVAPPYMGPYSASKFALEAITDALRVELRTWNIGVSLVEPGPIATPIWEKATTAAEQLSQSMPDEPMKLYEAEISILRKAIEKIASNADPVDCVVQAVLHALTSPKPKTRYFLRFRNRFLFRGFKVVPDVIRDWFIRRAIGLP